mgnify:CR=1 FL=1
MELRTFLAAAAVVLAVCGPATASEHAAPRYEPVQTDDGLLAQPWFLNSFLDLKEDQAEAAANGKTFAIVWELKGCPYCKTLHTSNFARHDIQTLARSRFDVLQLNIIGSRKVVDFDGEELSEKQLAQKRGIRFTPTMQFYAPPKDGEPAAEVFRMSGYYKPFPFYTLLHFVSSGAYRETGFRPYLKERHRALTASGGDPESW